MKELDAAWFRIDTEWNAWYESLSRNGKAVMKRARFGATGGELENRSLTGSAEDRSAMLEEAERIAGEGRLTRTEGRHKVNKRPFVRYCDARNDIDDELMRKASDIQHMKPGQSAVFPVRHLGDALMASIRDALMGGPEFSADLSDDMKTLTITILEG